MTSNNASIVHSKWMTMEGKEQNCAKLWVQTAIQNVFAHSKPFCIYPLELAASLHVVSQCPVQNAVNAMAGWVAGWMTIAGQVAKYSVVIE